MTSHHDMHQLTEDTDAYRGPRPMRPADPSARVIGYLGLALAALLLIAVGFALGVWIAAPMTALLYAATFLWGGVVGVLALMVLGW